MLLGSILVVSALLKEFASETKLVPGLGWMGRSDLQTPLILAELLLGGWLISGIERIQAALVGLIAFAIFSIINFKLAIGGETDCACFGDFTVHPFITGMLDIAAAACLAWILRISYRSEMSEFWWAVSSVAGVAACIGALAGYSYHRYNSIDSALNSLMGKALVVPTSIDLGKCTAEGTIHVIVEITNDSNRLIRVVHGTTDCSCMSTTRLPLDLDSGSRGTVDLRLNLRKSPVGPFQKRVEFWYSADSGATMAMVSTTVIGRVE